MVKNVSAKLETVGGQRDCLVIDRWGERDQESCADKVIFQMGQRGYTMHRADPYLNFSWRGSDLLGL